MDDSSFNQYRERIGATLTTRLNDAYSQGIVSEDESPIIARFILDNIDKIKNHEELLKFLEELSQKWTLFGPILMMEKAEKIEEKNDETVGQVEKLIKENKIDEALKTAEDATSTSQSEGGTT